MRKKSPCTNLFPPKNRQHLWRTRKNYLSACIFKAHIEKHLKGPAVDASRSGNASTV